MSNSNDNRPKAGTIFDRPSDHEVKQFVQGKFTVEFFPEGYILLNRELATGYHPALEILLQQIPADEIDLRLSVIAHYLGIVLDGTYTIEARSELCAIMSGRLELCREFAAAQTVAPISAETKDNYVATPEQQGQSTDGNSVSTISSANQIVGNFPTQRFIWPEDEDDYRDPALDLDTKDEDPGKTGD
jgi:hypothetical protein